MDDEMMETRDHAEEFDNPHGRFFGNYEYDNDLDLNRDYIDLIDYADSVFTDPYEFWTAKAKILTRLSEQSAKLAAKYSEHI